MPVVLKIRVGASERILRGRAHSWSVIRALDKAGELITTRKIVMRSNEPHSATISGYLRQLHAAGVLDRVSSPPDAAAYRLVKDQAQPPSLAKNGQPAGSAQQAMWNVMRGPVGRQGFCANDLVTYGSTDVTPVSLNTAKTYIQRLAAAGYLTVIRKGQPGQQAIYRLKPSMNTGPLPPKVLRSHIVWDANREAVIGDAIAEEERP